MNQRDEYYRRKEEEMKENLNNNIEPSKKEPENNEEQSTFDKMKEFVKRNKGKVIGGAAVLGTAATLALGSIAGQHDIDPDNGKIDIVIPGIEKPIQIPDIGGQVGDIISGVVEDIPGIRDIIDTENPDTDDTGSEIVNNNNNLPGYEISPLPEVTPRDPEEIAETGVTAQDVLDLLDIISLKLYQYPIYNDRADYGDNWENLKGQIISISTSNYFVLGEDGNYHAEYYPFYAYSKEFTINHPWFKEGEILERDVRKLKNVYYVTFNYRTGLDNRAVDNSNSDMGISYDDFCALMEVFDVEKFTLTKETKEKYENHKFFSSKFIGQTVYAPFELTRQVIEDANQEQLNVLYKVINNSITSINFEGKLPDTTIDYEMLD